jgi:hypothetical protein
LADIAKSIVGQWGIHREKMMNNNDSLIYFERIKPSKSGSYAGYLNFEPNGTCQLKIKGHHNTKTQDGTWAIKGIDNIIAVTIPNRVFILIDFVTTDTLSGFVQSIQ